MNTALSADVSDVGSVLPEGLLKINTSHGFGRRVVTPALSAFACRYPSAKVMLQLSDRPLDLQREGFDAGIVIGHPDTDRTDLRDGQSGHLTRRWLCSNRRVLCAAPAYLKQRGMPLTLADLSRHQAILLEEDDQSFGQWRLRRGDDEQTVDVHGAMYTNDGESAVRWALDGLGILLRSEWDIGTDLKAGRLVVLVPQWSMPADVWAVTPPQRPLATRTRLFLDFLAQWLER